MSKKKPKAMFSLWRQVQKKDADRIRRQLMQDAGDHADDVARLHDALTRFAAAHETVFRNVSPDHLPLLDQVGPPQYVPVQVWEKSEPSDCHRNVFEYVAKNGGSAVQGYRVYENNFQLNGEHHSVWKSPDGMLVDITQPWSPRCDGDPTCKTKVAFIPLDELAPGLADAERKGFVIYHDVEVLLELQKPFLEGLLGERWDEWAQQMREREGIRIDGDR